MHRPRSGKGHGHLLPLLVALSIILIYIYNPARCYADWRATASNLIWFTQKPTATITTYRDALLWFYEGRSIDGLLATSARSNIAVTDLGGGNSELSVTLTLSVGNSWVTALSTRACPTAATTADRRTCANSLIVSDFKRIWSLYQSYLRDVSTPLSAPPDL